MSDQVSTESVAFPKPPPSRQWNAGFTRMNFHPDRQPVGRSNPPSCGFNWHLPIASYTFVRQTGVCPTKVLALRGGPSDPETAPASPPSVPSARNSQMERNGSQARGFTQRAPKSPVEKKYGYEKQKRKGHTVTQ